jgi:hypothetical protein
MAPSVCIAGTRSPRSITDKYETLIPMLRAKSS